MSRAHQLRGLPASQQLLELMRQLAEDQHRTERIVAQALACWGQGRKLFLLHGQLSAQQRSDTLAALQALPADAPRSVLATGHLVGEGFNHPPLDKLLRAMPVSWKGTLRSTPAACTGSKLANPACGSSTGSISAIRCLNACGSGGCGALGRCGSP